MTVRMLFWAIMEIAVDIVLLYVVLSNSTAWLRKIVKWIIAAIIALDILGIIDWTVWRFLKGLTG
ncbi:MAG: hypothetical protein OXT74_07840 [Candidatus Poribacteria bacterium]|nr:hypothetical protein [Candidatus Poribacteria bacterium]